MVLPVSFINKLIPARYLKSTGMATLSYDSSAEYFKVTGFGYPHATSDIYRINTGAFSAQSVGGISYPDPSITSFKKERGSDGKYYPHVDYNTGTFTFLTRQVPLNVLQAFDVIFDIFGDTSDPGGA